MMHPIIWFSWEEDGEKIEERRRLSSWRDREIRNWREDNFIVGGDGSERSVQQKRQIDLALVPAWNKNWKGIKEFLSDSPIPLSQQVSLSPIVDCAFPPTHSPPILTSLPPKWIGIHGQKHYELEAIKQNLCSLRKTRPNWREGPSRVHS